MVQALRSFKYFCRRNAAVVLRNVAEGLRFDCGQYGSLHGIRGIFAVSCGSLRLLKRREPRLELRMSVKVILALSVLLM